MLGEHPPSIRMWTRLFGILLGEDADDRRRIRGSALAAILGTVAYPFVANLDDATVREELLRISKGLVFEHE
jgi:hypothetical protein